MSSLTPYQVFIYPRMFSIHDMSDDSGLPSVTGESDGTSSVSYLLTCYVMSRHVMSHLFFPLLFYQYLFVHLVSMWLFLSHIRTFTYFYSVFINCSIEYLSLYFKVQLPVPSVSGCPLFLTSRMKAFLRKESSSWKMVRKT